MSAIIGIINFDRKPVTKECMLSMQTPMQYWGPDGEGVWFEENAGLGMLHLYNTPESVYEKLPMFSHEGNLVITAAGRIDNRAELSTILRINLYDETIPDSVYMLKAFEKWGSDSPKHLFGDWAFAVFNKKEKTLFLARDHFGNTSLYYHYCNNFFAFASSKKGLFGLPISKTINELPIALVLTGFFPEGETTFYKEIKKLPPAHSSEISTSGEFSVKQYWYLENAPQIRFKKDEEYTEAFLEKFTNAVNYRLRSFRPVGSTLSGGLDSGSVTALAAIALKDKYLLNAYTSIPLYNANNINPEKYFTNELPYAKMTADHVGNINLIPVNSENISPLDGLLISLNIFDEPIRNASNSYWIYAISENAKEAKIGSLLTGQRGNITISWPSNDQCYVKPGIKNHIKSTIYFTKQFSSQLLKLIKNYQNPYTNNSFISSSFAKKIGKTIHFKRELDWLKHRKDLRIPILNPELSTSGSLYNELGAHYNLNIYDPTVDTKLIEYCFAIPQSQFYSPSNRGMIKKSMTSILPDNILFNNKRGIQAFDVAERTYANRSNLFEFYNSFSSSTLHGKYLDINKLKEIINYVEKKNPISKQKYTSLYRCLMVGAWLTMQKKLSE